jgi:hypothetical protein
MAALVTEGTDSLQVALAHLFFNVFGIVVWYPVPFMRRVPMHAARQLGKATRAWKGFPILYILVAFFVFPLILMGLSTLFSSKESGQILVATILLILIVVAVVGLTYWWARMGGRERTGVYFAKRQLRVNALETLPYDMVWAQRRIKEIQEHTGIASGQPTPTDGLIYDVYADVAKEMDHLIKNVNALVHHVGLEKEVDTEGLGRFYHKSKEQMPGVDMTNKYIYMWTIILIGAALFAMYIGGVVALFQTGSVATKGMGGYLLVMLALFLIWRVHARLTGDGAALSEAAYIDKELKKMYRVIYTERMAQMTADVLKLTVETQMPAFEADKLEKEKEAVPTSDEDTNAASNEEMSA